MVQPFLPDDGKKSKKKKKGKKKKVVESSSDESSDDSSDEDSSSSDEEEPVPVKKSKKNQKKKSKPVPPKEEPKKLSKNQLKKQRKREREAAAAEEEKKKAAAAEAAKVAEAEAKAKKEEEAKKAAEQGKKKLSKKQRKKLAAAERLKKEEEEKAAAAAAKKKGKKKKGKKQTEQDKPAEEVAQPQKPQEKKKKGKKKKQAAPEPVPEVLPEVIEEPVEEEEDSDGWEKVPTRGEKRKKKTTTKKAVSTEGNSQLPTGPIVQEILELGSKPINPKDDDQIKKKIFDVLGFPTRRSRDDDDSIEDDSKFGRNVRLFKSKLNVHMEFNETRSKYYLIMNGAAQNCQDAIRAANQLFEKGYSDILTPGMTQDSFPVAEKDRGAVVGKGGVNMQAIQDEFCVQIRLPARNGPSDLVTLSGPTEGVKKAKIAIMQLINTGISDITHPDSAVCEVMIPNRRKAALIGTRGSNIQRIQREYNCRVNVPQNVPGQRPNDKVAVVIAGEKALIDAAVADVKESVAEPEPEQIPGFSKELTCEYDPWSED